MAFTIDAACICSTGKLRRNNEDNFFFDGRTLAANNDGLAQALVLAGPVKKGLCFAVFDGMGGEKHGEHAAFAAAEAFKKASARPRNIFLPEQTRLKRLCSQLNDEVCASKREFRTAHMGATMAALFFLRNSVFSCNLGDSRVYLLRRGNLVQLSEDHVERRPNQAGRKGAITQYLGVDPEEYLIEPCLKQEALEQGDRYLLCSDGLSDMLADQEIAEILRRTESAKDEAERLLEAALAAGGKDNTTAIVCHVH